MESFDPVDKQRMDDQKTRKKNRRKMIILLCLLVLFVVFLILVIHPHPAEVAVDKVSNAAAKIKDEPAPVPLTDSGLRDQNRDLKAEVEKGEAEVRQLQTQVKTLQSDLAAKERQAKATEQTLAATVKERDDYRDKYNNGPLYAARLNRSQGWHLHFGGIVSNPLDFGSFNVEPTLTLLFGAGPERWQVLGGLGVDKDGLSVSVGFMYTWGDIGEWRK